ncbi:MAG: hypothetical protein RIT81_04535 [Deltaproteobacteria bacterium]
MDLIYLGLAIGVVYLARMLRAFGSLPHGRTRAAWTDERPPVALAELYRSAFERAMALGFGAPRWVLIEEEHDDRRTPFAVLAHPDGGLLWMAPPAYVGRIKRIFLIASNRLADGRSVLSQDFDTFFASCPTDEVIGRAGAELELEDFVAAHRAFVSEQGVRPIVEDDATILDQYAGVTERHRQAMIADGRLRAVDDDVALPSLRLSLHFLRAWFGMKKPPAETGPFSAELLEQQVARAEALAARGPLRSVELALFVSSIVAFAIAGALLFDPWSSGVLLVVIVLHELGHYLTMRWMGYENVQLLALPLVGGVTMGRDASPSASKQAWMSLMGPLPGIPIGVVLMAAALLGGDATGSPLFVAGVLFLVLNYLNLLPVPPLDGARVLEAMLPPRFAKLQTIVFASVAVIGVLVSVYFDLWILAGVAGLQLATVRRRWRLHDVEADLTTRVPPGRAHDATTSREVLEAIERRLGPAQNNGRIAEAVAVRDRVRTEPMGGLGRFATGSVYLASFGVPALVLTFAGLVSSVLPSYEEVAAQVDASQAAIDGMDIPELLHTATSTTLPPGVTEEALSVAEARLGRALPEELRSMYAAADGAPELGICALAQVRVADAAEISTFAATLRDNFEAEIDPASAPLVLEDSEQQLLYWSMPQSALDGCRLVVLEGDYAARYEDLKTWLAVQASTREMRRVFAAEQAKRIAKNRLELDALDDGAFLDRVFVDTEVGWLQGSSRGEGAEETSLSAAEARLGVRLPDELRAIYRRHDPAELEGIGGSADLAWVNPYEDLDLRTKGEPVPGSLGVALEPPSEGVPRCLSVAAWNRGEGVRPDVGVVSGRTQRAPLGRPLETARLPDAARLADGAVGLAEMTAGQGGASFS